MGQLLKKTSCLLLVITGLTPFMLPAPAYAVVPQLVPYQGQLTNVAGAPVNGTTNIIFNLYTLAIGGTSIWTEAHTGVNVTKGMFHVNLGSLTPFPVGAFSTPVYLGVTIGGDAEMSPRTALESSPYALHADDADTVGGFSSSQLDQSAHVGATNNPHGVTAGQVGAITGVTAGTGLTGGGATGAVTVNANTAYLQRRVAGACPAGQSIRAISPTGTVTCQVDNFGIGDITGVTAGTGLTGGGTTGAVTLGIGTGAVTATHLASNSVGMDELNSANFPSGTKTTTLRTGGGTIAFSYNYYMSTTNVRPSSNGFCYVSSTIQINSDPTDTGMGGYFRTAKSIGAGAPANDRTVGHYVVPVGKTRTPPATATFVWSVSAGTTYHFGCMIYGSGDNIGNSASCRVSWMCM